MIRFGIVGAGNIAKKFAKDISILKDAKLVAVASRDFDKAVEFCKEFDIQHAFGSYEELAKSNLIDAVYIATPHKFHKENSILFMEHNKHVLCEKPLAVNQKEVQEMFKVSKDNNTLLMEAMWTRYLPSIIRVKEIVQKKTYGSIKSMYLPFCANIGLNAPFEGRLLNPNLAGGSLLDVGIYPVSLLLYLLEEPFTYKKIDYLLHKTGVDMFVEIELVSETGVKVKLISGFDREDLDAKIEFDSGVVEIPYFFSSDHIIVNGAKELFPHLVSGFEYEIQSFVDTINEESIENTIMSEEESMKIIKELDYIRNEIKLKYPFE